MIKLKITEWGHSEEYLVYKNILSIGAHQNNDLILMNKKIPKRVGHLNIESENLILFSPSLGANPLFSGQVISEPTPIKCGDTIELDQTQILLLEFSLENPLQLSDKDSDLLKEQVLVKHPELSSIVDYLEKVGGDV